MTLSNKNNNVISLLISLLIHLAVFIYVSNSFLIAGEAQAPVYEKQVSITLLPVAKRIKDIVVDAEMVNIKKIAEKKVEKKKKDVQVEQKQATAQKKDTEIKRENIKKSFSVQKSYISTLLMHIEGYKRYPGSARRRNVEGNIKISFYLLDDGSITELSARGGARILRQAAMRSVTNALPFPPCPEKLNCSVQVNFVMKYKLR